jgi:arylsulfatase A-like enzyme
MYKYRRIKKFLPKSIKQLIRAKLTEFRNYRGWRRRKELAEELIKKAGLSRKSANGFDHILFIVIDCARRDNLSVYGSKRSTTPFLKSLLNKAVIFNNAIAPSPWTYPSVASILSGLYPHNHGCVFGHELRKANRGDMPQKGREDVLFLPEILEYWGFNTYFNSAIVTAALPVIGRFQTTKASHLKTAEEVISQYLLWMDYQKGKTFSYLQLGELHQPIQAPEPYRSIFGDIPDIPTLPNWDYLKDATFGNPEFERYRELRTKLYDASLRYVDAQLEYLFNKINSMGIFEDMLIVITADHGEELWEHLEMERNNFYDPRPVYGAGHGHHLWQEVVRVPLMLISQKIEPKVIKNTVSLIDLVPTVLDLIGVKGWDGLNLDGMNLFEQDPNRIIISEDVQSGYEKKVVYNGDYKLYSSQGDNVVWLFDLKKDSEEKEPIELPEVANHLLSYLPQREYSEREALEIDAEVKNRLKDLGYID